MPQLENRQHEYALLDAAAALHVLALASSLCGRARVAQLLGQRCLDVRRKLLPANHPLILESEFLQVSAWG